MSLISSHPPVFVTGFPGSGLRLLAAVVRATRSTPEDRGPIDQASPTQSFGEIEAGLLGTAGLDWNRLPATNWDETAFRSPLNRKDLGVLPSGVFASPTLVFTWPFWLGANPGARLAVSLRHPAEAIAALRRRHTDMNEGAAVDLWLAYARLALRALDDPRTLLFHFDSIFENPKAEIERLTGAQAGSFRIDRVQRTHWAVEGAVPARCASAYARLCAAAPTFSALRQDAGLEAQRREDARSACEVQRWRDERNSAAADRLVSVDQEALAAARDRALAAEERLQDIERSLVFRTTRLVWSLRDRVFPPGTRRRSFQRWLRLRIAGVSQAAGPFQGQVAELLDADDRQYQLFQKRTLVPLVKGPLPPVRLVTVDSAGHLSPATADSVRAQSHQAWTWRVAVESSDGADALAVLDPRITIAPERIDTSARLMAAVGDLGEDDVVVLLENGARLHRLALSKLVEAVQADGAEASYCDLDHVDGRGTRIRPWFKPDWSPDLTLSVDLLGPATAVRARHLKGLAVRDVPPAMWPWRLALHLRSSGAKVAHARHVLVHIPADARRDRVGAASLIGETLRAEGRRDVRVREEGRLRVEWRPATELVSIVIPTKDMAEVLGACLETLVGRTRYRPFEVILVDTGSRERATERLYESYRSRSGFSVVRDTGPFNFSRACNTGARAARGNRLLFLNNDTEILHEDWLDRMAQWLDDPGVGAVGARLLYPDATLQHAGVVVGLGGLAGHLFHRQPKGTSGAFGPEHWYRDLSAVTAACLLTSRQAFDCAGGFDETLELVYGDTDYCLRLRQIGLRIVYSPDAELVHHESQSRGKRVPRADFVRFSEKLLALGALDGDPYFSPGLSSQSTRPRLRLGALDDPKVLNRQFMARLPPKPVIIVPDDLF